MEDQNQLLLYQIQQAQEAEAERKAMLEDNLMRDLEVQANDPAVNLAPMAAIFKDNPGLVQAMGQSGAQQMGKEAAGQKRIDDLYSDLVANTGSGITKLSSSNSSAREEGKDDRFMTSQTSNWLKDIKKEFSKENRAMSDVDLQLAGIENAINSGSFERIKGQLSNFARAVNSEKGVLTDSDIGRTYIDTLDNMYVKFYSKFDKDGQIDPRDVKNLADALRDGRAKMGPVIQDRLQGLEETYASDPLANNALQRMGDKGIVNKTIALSGRMGGSNSLTEYYAKLKKAQAGESDAPAGTTTPWD